MSCAFYYPGRTIETAFRTGMEVRIRAALARIPKARRSRLTRPREEQREKQMPRRMG